MSDFIPEVIMNEEEISDNESEKGEETIDEITDIKTEEKKKIQEEDIFVNKKNKLEIKEVVEENIIKDIIEEKPKKKERKKRVMTEEHKQKLALAREKALAKRRENSARKKEMKQLEKEAEEQKYQLLKEKVRPQKKEVIKDTSGYLHEEEKKIEKELKKVNKNYTQEDLDNAVLNGIMKYDTLRKERKKKKQSEKDINRHEEQVKSKIRQVINQPVQDYNYFDNCY